MKKNKPKDREQEKKPRRLLLSRETIKALDEPSLLQMAIGGTREVTGDSGGARCAVTTDPV